MPVSDSHDPLPDPREQERERRLRTTMGSEAILMLQAPPVGLHVAYGPGEFQFGELCVPQETPATGPHPVVVVIHGGYWRAQYGLDHIRHLCAALCGEGMATWSLEYRRVGNPGGGWPGTFLDVARGTAHLRALAGNYPLDLDRVVVMGHSAGGQLALWVAGAHRVPEGSEVRVADPLPVRGAISLAGVCDLVRGWELGLSDGVVGEFLGGDPVNRAERYRAASPRALLPLGVRQVLVHGTDDPYVPFELSTGYLDAAREAGDDVTLIELPGMAHFEVIDPASAAWPDVLGAVLGCAEYTVERQSPYGRTGVA